MLTPENNFSREASIPPGVPALRLHPAQIGGWREAGGEAGREAGREAEREAGREAEREAGREAGGSRLEERLGESFVRLSFVRQSFVSQSFV